jgi:hypothetical protein
MDTDKPCPVVIAVDAAEFSVTATLATTPVADFEKTKADARAFADPFVEPAAM